MDLKHKSIDQLISMLKLKAVIFDLDGTLIDNNSFHLKTWLIYLKNMGINISVGEYKAHINGRTNESAINYIFGKKMSQEEIIKHTRAKEALYRKLYSPHIKPVEGLLNLLAFLKQKGIKMGIATSGIQPNIEFMFDHIPIKEYFTIVVNSAHIQKGKPDPEIYTKTAESLQERSENCLVFEDALPGIESAHRAGMKVIAVATTHAIDELGTAEGVIINYKELYTPQTGNKI